MKQIKIESNIHFDQFALVDDDLYDTLSLFQWHLVESRHTFYAKCSILKISMHRLVLGLQDKQELKGDHIDGNGLNNQRNNLRIATTGQNNCNRRTQKKYLGTYFNKSREHWVAELQSKGKTYRKIRNTEQEAALAYNEMASFYHGEFARLNIL